MEAKGMREEGRRRARKLKSQQGKSLTSQVGREWKPKYINSGKEVR